MKFYKKYHSKTKQYMRKEINFFKMTKIHIPHATNRNEIFEFTFTLLEKCGMPMVEIRRQRLRSKPNGFVTAVLSYNVSSYRYVVHQQRYQHFCLLVDAWNRPVYHPRTRERFARTLKRHFMGLFNFMYRHKF